MIVVRHKPRGIGGVCLSCIHFFQFHTITITRDYGVDDLAFACWSRWKLNYSLAYMPPLKRLGLIRHRSLKTASIAYTVRVHTPDRCTSGLDTV